MTLGEIIYNYRIENKMSMDEFSARSGISKGNISILENNRNPQSGKKPTPTIDTIRKVALAIGCDIDQIFSQLDKNCIINISESEMGISEFDRKLLSDFHSLSYQSQRVVQYILDNELKHEKERKKLEEEIQTNIPMRIFAYYGKIAAAGTSVEFADMISGTKEYPATDENKNADYTIGVSGDSMEPTFYDGDIVFVKRTTDLHMGDIGIFQKDNGIYIKEVGKDCLISHNPKYKPIQNTSEIRCLGKVLGVAE